MKLLASVFVTLHIALTFTIADHDVRPPDLSNHTINSTVPGQKIPRPAANDELWNKVICRGSNLMQMLNGNNYDAGQLLTPKLETAQSKYTDFPAEFSKWGFRHEEDDRADLGPNEQGLQDMIKGLEMKIEDEDWQFKQVVHGNPFAPNQWNTETYTVNDKEYRVTGARYNIIMNKKYGIMAYKYRRSVASAAGLRRPPVVEFPTGMMTQSSDVTWGMWAVEEGDNSLKHFLSMSVVSRQSLSVIKRAIRSIGKDDEEIPGWPGFSFSMDSEQGKALLGTPNGLGVAYTLAQHKDQLGLLEITNIKIFMSKTKAEEDPSEADPNMYFEVAPVKEPEEGD